MKKVLLLLVALSAVSFADYNSVVEKFQKLNGELVQLDQTESQEFNKVIASAQATSQDLESKKVLRANLAQKISKLESASSTKYYQTEYAGIVKEYKGVLATLDSEIKALTKTVDDYNTVISLKGGK